MSVPTLDLHPEFFPRSPKGPEEALVAAREFLQTQSRTGVREARLITGLGLHGDGTPRLRRRVEREVLPGLHHLIEEVQHAQGGAVLRVFFKKPSHQGEAQRKKVAEEHRHRHFVQKQERLMVGQQRLDLAWRYLEEGDLRRARLKVNQLCREHGTAEVDENLESIRGGLEKVEALLRDEED
jgi:hypothetical protein